MCGIAGIFLPKGHGPLNVDLDAMARIMVHRGPDGDGRYVSPDGLYHGIFRRLAIIDLDGADQPLIERGGPGVLLGNGEVYNYQELRRRFADFPYTTDGDMEAVLAAYRALGDDYVAELNGMYALALYDGAAHSLDLVRDRLGVKPLYWAEVGNGGIVFASEIKSLFVSGLVRPEINSGAVSAYLTHGYVPAPETLFKGVRKLPPGHRLQIAADGTQQISTYWQPHAATGGPSTPDEIEAHLLALLEDSVRLQLRSDVPVGLLLSGGLDSGLIAAMAAAHTHRPLNTFTARFDGAAIDEAPLAAMVAERYGTHHQVLTVGATDALRDLPKLAWHCEEPLNDAAALPNYLIEKALSRHVTVALNGTGGDELFAGYGRYFPLPVERQYLNVPTQLRRHVIEPLVGLATPMRAWQLSRAALFDAAPGDYLNAHSTHFPPPVRRLIGNPDAPTPSAQQAHYEAFLAASPNSGRQSGMLAADIGTYLSDDLLTLLDRTSMAVNVEGRVPFLDHRLVEAALAVPESIRTPNGRQKGLERKMAARYLPDLLLNAPKHGFVSPVPGWMRGDVGVAAHVLLTRPQALDRGWWSAAGVDALLADPVRHGYRVYSLLALEMAVSMFTERPLDEAAPEMDLMDFAHE